MRQSDVNVDEIFDIAEAHTPSDVPDRDIAVARTVSAIREAMAMNDARKPQRHPPISREIRYLARVFIPRRIRRRTGHAEWRLMLFASAGIIAVAYLMKHGLIGK